ncbi:hypothetical protein ACJIZ3_003655 [Penstemon smallii]|uniref:Secreted protein n=1 Tax=Penstemon smallii TaxID=265156 RepID=A0ABD3UB50_9LAMI
MVFNSLLLCLFYSLKFFNITRFYSSPINILCCNLNYRQNITFPNLFSSETLYKLNNIPAGFEYYIYLGSVIEINRK